MKDKVKVTALILAGGEGRRMGGVDKGLQLYFGSPMVSYAVNLAAPFVEKTLISANRNVEEYKAFADRVVLDKSSLAQAGPLAGILSALEYIETSHILVLPCDTPKLTEDALSKLLLQVKENPELVHYFLAAGRPQPLHCVLPTVIIKQTLMPYLSSTNNYSVMNYFREIGCEKVCWDEDWLFDNINFKKQLASK